MIMSKVAICGKSDFKIIFDDFDNLTVVPSDPMCGTYCMLPFSCFDISSMSKGCQQLTYPGPCV